MLFGGFTADSTYVRKCSGATAGRALPDGGLRSRVRGRKKGGERQRGSESSWRQEAAIKPAPRRRVDRDVFKTYSSIRRHTHTIKKYIPGILSFSTISLLRSSPPRFLPCSAVVFFFLSGERPVKSAVYYVFRSHPDKNTRHARTTHSALSSYLS